MYRNFGHTVPNKICVSSCFLRLLEIIFSLVTSAPAGFHITWFSPSVSLNEDETDWAITEAVSPPQIVIAQPRVRAHTREKKKTYSFVLIVCVFPVNCLVNLSGIPGWKESLITSGIITRKCFVPKKDMQCHSYNSYLLQ